MKEDKSKTPLPVTLSWAINTWSSLQMCSSFLPYQVVFGQNTNISSTMTYHPPALLLKIPLLLKAFPTSQETSHSQSILCRGWVIWKSQNSLKNKTKTFPCFNATRFQRILQTSRLVIAWDNKRPGWKKRSN